VKGKGIRKKLPMGTGRGTMKSCGALLRSLVFQSKAQVVFEKSGKKKFFLITLLTSTYSKSSRPKDKNFRIKRAD